MTVTPFRVMGGAHGRVKAMYDTLHPRKKVDQVVLRLIVKPPDQTLAEVIQHHSHDAAVVFLGLMEPEPGTEAFAFDKTVVIQDSDPQVVKQPRFVVMTHVRQ